VPGPTHSMLLSAANNMHHCKLGYMPGACLTLVELHHSGLFTSLLTLERQDLSRTYSAHHELESNFFNTITVTLNSVIIITITVTVTDVVTITITVAVIIIIIIFVTIIVIIVIVIVIINIIIIVIVIVVIIIIIIITLRQTCGDTLICY